MVVPAKRRLFMDKLSTRMGKLAYWRGVIADWRSSGSPQAACCRERGLPSWEFAYWLRQATMTEADHPELSTAPTTGSDLWLIEVDPKSRTIGTQD
jgi:hypothetical protein